MTLALRNRTPMSKVLLISLWVISTLAVHLFLQRFEGSPEVRNVREVEERSDEIPVCQDEKHERTNEQFIFVGGMPRSGTTLMRTMLDAHPDVRCGQETHIIPILLEIRKEWIGSANFNTRLLQGGVLPHALDNAVAQFLVEIISGHAPPAKYLCNKDPYTQKDVKYLHKLFPNAKFLFMIRDGRAIAHSIITRGVRIAHWDGNTYRDILGYWNGEVAIMYNECEAVGREYCLPVYYEQLVLQPVHNTKRIFNFLGIPWDKKVLHHEQYLNGTKLSKVEVSTDQVQKPLYLDALRSWFGQIPEDVERDMARIAPMLRMLGYDPYDRTPYYGDPDEYVLSKMSEEERSEYLKRMKRTHKFQ